MWISELSRRSGVTVATIKYYLREGLVPPGRATGATRAQYDESHVQRLRLIRALVDVAGMGLDRVRTVLDALDDDTASLHDVLAAAHGQLSGEPGSAPSPESTEAVRALVRQRRWRVDLEGRHATALALALDALRAADLPFSPERLSTYADAAGAVAAVDVGGMSGRDRASSATYAITGTVLTEPVLLSLRRLAHENLSNRRFARR